jgi:23S rRNA (cytosine1962-C5)-methyltransferase
VFSGAVARVDGNPGPGDTVGLRSADGELLARAAFSPSSQIRARAWTFVDEPVDEALIERRLAAAVAARGGTAGVGREHRRLPAGYAESDACPASSTATPAPWSSVLTAGAERWRAVAGLPEADRAAAGVGAPDVEAQPEGLVPGRPLPAILRRSDRIQEGCDAVGRRAPRPKRSLPRPAKPRAGQRAATGRRVLGAFCYFGGRVTPRRQRRVGVAAMPRPRLALAAQPELNGLTADRFELLEGNVFEVLRGLRDRGRSFDLIVLDPPKFAATASQRQGAARGYKDINLLAFKLLAPGGLLVTFSCSGAVGGELFQSIVAGAALDAGVDAQVVERLGQSPDHPVLLSFPEAEYLKGLICRVGG